MLHVSVHDNEGPCRRRTVRGRGRGGEVVGGSAAFLPRRGVFASARRFCLSAVAAMTAPGGRRGARTKDLAAVNCCPERGLGLGEALERGPLGRRRGPRRSGRRRHRTQGSKRREREGERENAKKAFSLEAPLGSHSFSVSSSFFSFFRSPRISRLRSRASSSK